MYIYFPLEIQWAWRLGWCGLVQAGFTSRMMAQRRMHNVTLLPHCSSAYSRPLLMCVERVISGPAQFPHLTYPIQFGLYMKEIHECQLTWGERDFPSILVALSSVAQKFQYLGVYCVRMIPWPRTLGAQERERRSPFFTFILFYLFVHTS